MSFFTTPSLFSITSHSAQPLPQQRQALILSLLKEKVISSVSQTTTCISCWAHWMNCKWFTWSYSWTISPLATISLVCIQDLTQYSPNPWLYFLLPLLNISFTFCAKSAAWLMIQSYFFNPNFHSLHFFTKWSSNSLWSVSERRKENAIFFTKQWWRWC